MSTSSVLTPSTSVTSNTSWPACRRHLVASTATSSSTRNLTRPDAPLARPPADFFSPPAAGTWLLRRPRPRQPGISLVQMRRLRGHQRVNLALMVLVIGKTFIDLGSGQSGETAHHLVHRSPRLDHRHHIMHADACALHDGMPGAHPGSLHNVAVTRRNHATTVSDPRIEFKPAGRLTGPLQEGVLEK